MATSGIELRGVGYAVAGKAILTGIDLHLSEARIGIVGRNGSGKTSLMRVMAGLVAPSSGAVRVAGKDPARDRRAMLAQVGILFQNPDHQILFPTVGEELAFGLTQMGQATKDARMSARAILAQEGRAHWEGAATHTLSQGQRQYLCLLAVLAMEPATLLLDEPFAAVDAATEQSIIQVLGQQRDLGKTILVVHHDLHTVPQYFDHVLLINVHAVAWGPIEQVFTEENLKRTYGGRLTILEEVAEAMRRNVARR